MHIGKEIHVRHLGLWQVATVIQVPNEFGVLFARIGRREQVRVSRFDWAYKERHEQHNDY